MLMEDYFEDYLIVSRARVLYDRATFAQCFVSLLGKVIVVGIRIKWVETKSGCRVSWFLEALS